MVRELDPNVVVLPIERTKPQKHRVEVVAKKPVQEADDARMVVVQVAILVLTRTMPPSLKATALTKEAVLVTVLVTEVLLVIDTIIKV